MPRDPVCRLIYSLLGLAILAWPCTAPTAVAQEETTSDRGDDITYWMNVLQNAPKSGWADAQSTRITGWSGDILLPAPHQAPWDEFSYVTAERHGNSTLSIKLNKPGEPRSYAMFNASRGPAAFARDDVDTFSAGRMICNGVAYPDQPPPPFHYCVGAEEGMPLSEYFGRDDLHVHHWTVPEGLGTAWTAVWYDADTDLSYELDLRRAQGEWFSDADTSMDAASEIAGAVADLAPVSVPADSTVVPRHVGGEASLLPVGIALTPPLNSYPRGGKCGNLQVYRPFRSSGGEITVAIGNQGDQAVQLGSLTLSYGTAIGGELPVVVLPDELQLEGHRVLRIHEGAGQDGPGDLYAQNYNLDERGPLGFADTVSDSYSHVGNLSLGGRICASFAVPQ